MPEEPKKEPVAKFPLGTLIIWLVLTLGLIMLGGFNAWTIYKETVKAWENSNEIQQLTDEITYLDEVLTMSARLRVSSDNKFWEDRYMQYEPLLREVIDNIKKLSSMLAWQKLVEKTEKANNLLVALEMQAFSLVNKGEQEKAIAVLFSKEYEDNKKVYSKGMQDFIKEIELNNKKEIDKHEKQLIWFSFFCLIILCFGWYVILYIFGKQFVKRRQIEIDLERTRKRQELILNSAGEGIYGLDKNGNTTFVNPAAEKMLGYSLQEMSGHSQHDLIHHSKRWFSL
ncbi:MAG: PAS domain-containing protein [Nitrospinota bacterium]